MTARIVSDRRRRRARARRASPTTSRGCCPPFPAPTPTATAGVGAADLTAIAQALGSDDAHADVDGDGVVDDATSPSTGASIFGGPASTGPPAFAGRPIFAGGPFSDRNPFPDPATGTPSDRFPRQRVPRPRSADAPADGWPGPCACSAPTRCRRCADNPLARTLPDVDLRDRYRDGLGAGRLHQRQRSSARRSTTSTTTQQDMVVAKLKQPAAPLLRSARRTTPSKACCARRSTAATATASAGSWSRFDGDSQPLGYTHLRRDHRTTTASAPTSRTRPSIPTMPAAASATQMAQFLRFVLVQLAGATEFSDPFCFRELTAWACPPPSRNVLGNTSLDRFDAMIIGSGAGGSAAAYVLTSAGLKVLILEAGNNYFPGLDDPTPGMPVPLYSNDELKARDPARSTARTRSSSRARSAPSETDAAAAERGRQHPEPHRRRHRRSRRHEVPALQRGRLPHRLGAARRGRAYDGTSFIDWPLDLRRARAVLHRGRDPHRRRRGRQRHGADPFASRRCSPYPMPPSAEMYVGRLLGRGRAAGRLPSVPLSRPRSTRVPTRHPGVAAAAACVSCGFCSGFGCPNNCEELGGGDDAARRAAQRQLPAALQLLSSRGLRRDGTGRHIIGVEYIDPDGAVQTATADQFILAASAMESARLACSRTSRSAKGPALPPRPPHALPLPDERRRHLPAAHPRRARPVGHQRHSRLPRRHRGRHRPHRRTAGRSAASSSSAPRRSRSAPDKSARSRSTSPRASPASAMCAEAAAGREPVPRAHRGDDHAGRGRAAGDQPRRPRSQRARRLRPAGGAADLPQPSLRARRRGVLQAAAWSRSCAKPAPSSASSTRPPAARRAAATSWAACAWAADPARVGRATRYGQLARRRQPLLHGRRRRCRPARATTRP